MDHRSRKTILIHDLCSELSTGGLWVAFETRQGSGKSACSSECMGSTLVSSPLHELNLVRLI
jgi:hypothetical protein